MTDIEIDKIIKNTFKEFIKLYLIKDNNLYQKHQENIDKSDRYSFNPRLLTEDILKVKYGGMLESKIIEKSSNYSVSSELKIYSDKNKPNQRADLIIHEIKNDLCTKNNDIIESLIAVIEIKYANFKTPYFDFDRDFVKNDITKLLSLKKPKLLKYLLLFDEGNKLNDKDDKSNKYIKFYKEMIDNAKMRGIIILSNNESL